MSIKNYGFILTDESKYIIYVDLYLYYIVYASSDNSKEIETGELIRDWQKLKSDLSDLSKYTCYVDLRKDIWINPNTKSDYTRINTINNFFNAIKSLLDKSAINKFYAIGVHIQETEVFTDNASEDTKVLTFEYTKNNGYSQNEYDTNRLGDYLKDDLEDGEVKIVQNFMEDCLKRLAVVRNPHDEPIYLESANVFASEYVFVKRLFICPEIKQYFIYCLLMQILKCVRNQKIQINELTLVSASDTGAMLVTEICLMADSLKEISSVPKMKSQHMLHIGPKANFDRHGFDFNHLLGAYIYIYDFMCEGNEYRSLKNLFAIKDAEFLAACGVAIYDLPRINAGEYDDKSNIYALVNVKAWKELDKKYVIAYEKDEINK